MRIFIAATSLFEGVDTNSLDGVRKLLENAVSLLSYAVGALAVIFIIIGGIQYITAGGNPDGVSKAKKTITYAIIGVIMALSINVIIFAINTLF